MNEIHRSLRLYKSDVEDFRCSRLQHRYYGESMPFGSTEAAYATPDSRAFLTAEQALADAALLLTSLQSNLTASHCPIVVFGGSYGGSESPPFVRYNETALSSCVSFLVRCMQCLLLGSASSTPT